MEPIKLEENIREKLQDRTIEPSNDAWKKLSTSLHPNKQKRFNKSIWVAVAASFIGIVVIASFLFKDELFPSQIKPELVEETNNNKIITIDKNTSIVVAKDEYSNNGNSKFLENTIKKEQASTIKEIAVTNKIIKASKSKGSVIEEEVLSSINDSENSEEDVFIKFKVDEVVAQVQELHRDKESVSAEEINALLLKAQSDIQIQRIIKSKQGKVDATALLNAVEMELETSFRDKVFEALGEGFEKIRTAVVERNN